MKGLIVILVILAIWFMLNAFVLPRFGIQT